MSTPLRELLTGILFDGPTRAGFTSDPAAFLQDHGWGDLDGADVHDALTALVDDVPLDRAAAIAPVADADPAEAAGLHGAVDGLLLATASVDARFGVADDADPAAGLDRFDAAATDSTTDTDTDVDPFDATSNDAEPAAENDSPPADDGVRFEDLADVDNPEDLDGIVELGEIEPLQFDPIPELDHLDELADPFVDHNASVADHGPVDHTDDSAEPDDLDFD